MTTSIINPEVLNQDTSILEASPMTDGEEKELVIVKTAISTAYADKLERDLAIGAGLLKIFRRKLYRGKDGGRTWEEWLADESAELTGGRGAIAEPTSRQLRGFYMFRSEILPNTCSETVPLPAAPSHVRPLLGQLDSHPQAAVEMWKAACSQAGKGKVPTHDQVQRAALSYKANADNEARRLSAAQREALQKANAARSAQQDAPVSTGSSKPSIPQLPDSQQPGDSAPQTIPAWELDKEDSSLDAGAECKRIAQALNDAYKAVSSLRGILYNQINQYGRDYLGTLRQVDAGVYSLNNIDEQISGISEDVDFITQLLNADVGEGELARSTVSVTSFPTRD